MKRFVVHISRTPRETDVPSISSAPTGTNPSLTSNAPTAATNPTPQKASFVVEFDETRTIIDLLGEIEGHHDSGIVYRHSCHHGSCGTCAVRVNGREGLACLTVVESIGSDELTIEPIRSFAIRADLVVDPSPLFYEETADFSNLRSVRVEAKLPEIDEFTRFENCIECGLCVAVCPAGDDFVGPSVLAALAAEIEKHPDRAEGLLSLATGPRGVDGCIQAFECSRVCPTGVYPSRKIVDLRTLFEARKKRD